MRRAAKELAGDSGAGICLEVPRHLQSSLKALESFNLKRKNPGLKRNVKFDDASLDLVMDICLDPDNSSTWRRITPACAKAMKKKLNVSRGNEVGQDELEKMLDDSPGMPP